MFNKKTNETKRENKVEIITLRNEELILNKTYKFDLSEFYPKVVELLYEVAENSWAYFKDYVYDNFEGDIRDEIDLVFCGIHPEDLELYCSECNIDWKEEEMSNPWVEIPPYCPRNHKTQRIYLTVKVFYREGDQ